MGVYNKYPPEVHEFVRENCTKMRDNDLAEACNKALGTHFTKDSLKAFRANHKYRNGMGSLTSEEYRVRYGKYTLEAIEYIKANSWGVSSREMAERLKEKFGIVSTPAQIRILRQKLGVKSGVTGWYQRGHTPGNKGRTIDEYMSPETAAKVRQSAFRPGHVPANCMPVGSLRVCENRLYRKVSMTGTLWERWKCEARLVWEAEHGPIPEGKVILHLDRNPLNCSIENLKLVDKADVAVMARKGYFCEDPAVTESGATLACLMRTAKERRKKHEQKQKGNDSGSAGGDGAGNGNSGNNAGQGGYHGTLG